MQRKHGRLNIRVLLHFLEFSFVCEKAKTFERENVASFVFARVVSTSHEQCYLCYILMFQLDNCNVDSRELSIMMQMSTKINADSVSV